MIDADKIIDIRLTTTPDLKMACLVVSCTDPMTLEELSLALEEYVNAMEEDVGELQ